MVGLGRQVWAVGGALCVGSAKDGRERSPRARGSRESRSHRLQDPRRRPGSISQKMVPAGPPQPHGPRRSQQVGGCLHIPEESYLSPSVAGAASVTWQDSRLKVTGCRSTFQDSFKPRTVAAPSLSLPSNLQFQRVPILPPILLAGACDSSLQPSSTQPDINLSANQGPAQAAGQGQGWATRGPVTGQRGWPKRSFCLCLHLCF